MRGVGFNGLGLSALNFVVSCVYVMLCGPRSIYLLELRGLSFGLFLGAGRSLKGPSWGMLSRCLSQKRQGSLELVLDDS